uniref:hypothetical protein n=1 Tax=Russula emetica TaxID=152958 RepID=UPI0031F43255
MMIILNLILSDNNLSEYKILICCGFFLGYSIYYLIKKNNYFQPPTKNMEPFTYEEMETIFNENMVSISKENVEDLISDNNSTSDSDFDYESSFHSDSDSTSDTESILNDPDLFFMPNVDFDVCPIEELKLFEFTSLYSREMEEHSISEEEVMEFISWFSKEDLATNWINDLFLFAISLL